MSYRRFSHLRTRYRITKEDYELLLKSQKGLCAGCGKTPKSGGRNNANGYLFVDHNHVTFDVRGLLCQPCNASVGLAGDSPETLRKLADYLEREPAIKFQDLPVKDRGSSQRGKTHCIKGHEYNEENTRFSKTCKDKLRRHCRSCDKRYEQERKQRKHKKLELVA